MKRAFTFTLTFVFVIHSFAQSELPEFGKPDLSELKMKDCDFEKGVAVLKLYSFEIKELISDDLTVKTERKERIKILKESGFPSVKIEIPFSKKNKVKNITAYIFNLDESGKISTQKIENDEIYTKSEKKKSGSLIFTFPGLKIGSVIEYKIIEVENGASATDVKFFQTDIPIRLSIFKLVIPDYIKVDLSFKGEVENMDQLLEKKTPVESRNTHTITRKNITSFRKEPFMSSEIDNLQYLIYRFFYNDEWKENPISANFQKYYSYQWSSFNEWLNSHPQFGGQIELLLPGSRSLIDSCKKFTTVSKKVELIYQRIKNKIKWTGEKYIYAEDCDKVWKSGFGSNAEINLIILNLLKKSGVECYPILVRAREYGKATRTFFSLTQFSNVNVLVIDSTKYYILDGANTSLSYSTPPFEILNREVFLVDPKRSKWLNIVDPRPFLKNMVSIEAKADSTGNVTGSAFISSYDFIKSNKIAEKENKHEENEEKEIKYLLKETSDIFIDSLVEENKDDESKPLNQRFNYKYNPEFNADYIVIDPLFLSSFRKNPFLEQVRKTDIDFGSNQYYVVNLRFTIPENLVIENIPKSILIIANDSSMTFKRQTFYENNIILIRHSLEMNQAIFPKEEYPSVREFFRKMYDALNEKLILRKK